MHPNVHFSTIYNSQDMEATQCPSTDEWDKEHVAYIYVRILLSHKSEIMPFAATWMDLEIIILTEVRHKN